MSKLGIHSDYVWRLSDICGLISSSIYTYAIVLSTFISTIRNRIKQNVIDSINLNFLIPCVVSLYMTYPRS